MLVQSKKLSRLKLSKRQFARLNNVARSVGPYVQLLKRCGSKIKQRVAELIHVRTYTDSNHVYHGFLRSPKGQFTTFNAPGGGTGSYTGTGCSSDCPTNVNDFGAVMGTYVDSNFVYHGD